jgi:hypothetical protein
MRRWSVSNDQHWTPLDVVQIAQEGDKTFIVMGARTPFEDEVRIPAIQFVGKRPGQGQLFPIDWWRSTSVCPPAQVSRTEGSGTPDSSSNVPSAVSPAFGWLRRCVPSRDAPVAANSSHSRRRTYHTDERWVILRASEPRRPRRRAGGSTHHWDSYWLRHLCPTRPDVAKLFTSDLRQSPAKSSRAEQISARPSPDQE